MRRSKRIISLLCVACLLISMLPMQVFASTTGLSPAGQAILDAAIAQGLVQGQGQGQTQQQVQTAPVTPKGSEGIILERESSANKSNFKKFKDVKGHWAESYLEWSVDLGLFQGVTSTKFKPDDGITRAQMLAVITRAFGATEKADISMYLDVKEGDWYYEYVALAQQMGILSGYGNTISPNEKVTRQETAEAIVKAAGYTYGNLENIKHFPDYRTIDTNSRVYLATAIENGLLFGFSDGTLGPQKKVTRAQFAVMMHRMANAYYTPDHIYQGRYIEGSLLVGMPDLTLNNMYVDGNLFITEGCGTSTITIKDTTVGGSIIVRGTGANTVKLVNSKAHNVIMCNPNNATSLHLDEMSAVKSVYVRDGEGGVSLHGNLGDVYVDTAKCPVKITDSVVDTLYITAKLASVTADKLTSFNAIRVESAAAGAAVDVAGAVGSLHIGASDTTIRLQGSIEKLTFGGGVSKVNLTLPEETVLKNANLSADKLTMTLTGNIGDLTISGANCKITLDGDAVAEDIMVSGKGSSLVMQSGSKANKITLTGDRVSLDIQSGAKAHSVASYGDDVTIGSKGTVTGGITVNSGDNVKISIPNCDIYNRGGTAVYVGSVEVARGETVTTNNSGAIEKPEEEKPEEPKDPTDPEEPKDPEDPSGGENPEDPDDPSGGEDPENPDTPSDPKDPEEQLPKPDLMLSLAAEGQPSDFGNNNAYTYSMFGYNLAFDKTTLRASGKLNKIEDFYWFNESSGNSAHATGYYLPLTMYATIMTDDAKLYVGDAVFDKSVISTGSAYSGRWMVYVPLSFSDVTRGTIEVKFDPDGTGTNFGAGLATIDITNIELIGGMYGDDLWYETEAAPGLDGAETCTITIPSDQDTLYPFKINLSNEVLLETRGLNGAFGYWAGIVFKAPRGADSAVISVTRPDGTTASELYHVRDGKITWYGEADNAGANNFRTWTLSVTYRDSLQNNLDTVPTRYVLVNMSRVTLATSSTIIPEAPAASNIHLSTLTVEEAEAASIVLSDYGYNLRATAQSIAGVVFELAGATTKYQIPVKVTATIAEDTKLMVGDTVVGTLIYADPGEGEPAEASVVAKLPAEAYGSNVGDIELVAAPVAEGSSANSVTIHVDCSSLVGAAGGVFTSGVTKETTINGVTVSSLYSGEIGFQQGLSNYVTITGNLTKQSDYIDTGIDAWVLPLSVYVNTTLDNWVVRNELDNSSWYSTDYPSGAFEALVTIARSDSASGKTAYLDLYSVDAEGNEVMESSLMICLDGILEGYVNPAPTKPPVARGISVVAETDTEVLTEHLFETETYAAFGNKIVAELMPHEIPNETGPSTTVYNLPYIVQFTVVEPVTIECKNTLLEVSEELVGKTLLFSGITDITASDVEAGYITLEFNVGDDSEYANTTFEIDVSDVVLHTEE